MPKHTGLAKKSLIDEANPLSLVGGSGNGASAAASAERDYYELEARRLKLEQGVKALGETEARYAFGLAANAAWNDAAKTAATAGLYKLHEADLIEIKALNYLHSLPDTSPQLLQMKAIYKCASREQIAKKIAEQQMEELIKAQMNAIVNPTGLQDVYKTEMQNAGKKFANLYGANV